MSIHAKILLIIWTIVVILLGGLLLTRPLSAHPTWEEAAADGMPDYVFQSGCCGKGDCFQIPIENVNLIEDGYVFTAPQPDHPDEKYTVMEEEYGKKLRDSSDGRYWACFYIPGKECLEYGQGNGHYGGGCLKYSEKRGAWKLRCFFRPVNA
jgi:hypothetical protein